MSQEHIRSYIEVIQEMLLTEASPAMLTEDMLNESAPMELALDPEIESKLNDLVFKLRSYQDPDMGEYAAGVEAGMNRAADMLQNMINRLRGE